MKHTYQITIADAEINADHCRSNVGSDQPDSESIAQDVEEWLRSLHATARKITVTTDTHVHHSPALLERLAKSPRRRKI